MAAPTADTTITATDVSVGVAAVITAAGGTAINAAHVVRCLYPKEGKLAIMCLSSHANTALHFYAGEGVAADLGDLELAAANTVHAMFIVPSNRCKWFDGYVYWHYFPTDSAGYVKCVNLP